MNLLRKYENLQEVVARSPGAVAFSGGADSSLLLKAALDVFGERARAFFGDSILQTDADRDNATRTARRLGANLQVVNLFPLKWPAFTANSPDRCYFCKKKVYGIFKELLGDEGHVLLDGSNLDDLGQDRPGRRAIAELKVRTPLVETGLTKSDIRQLGKYLDIPTWNRESASCLATRIPAGLEINAENLSLVARYESILIDAGFSGGRVRLCKDNFKSVKIEVKETDMTKLLLSESREAMVALFKKTGVDDLWLSLRGR